MNVGVLIFNTALGAATGYAANTYGGTVSLVGYCIGAGAMFVMMLLVMVTSP